MEVCRRSSWLLLLLGVSLLATTLQGVQGEVESEGPSESECRPYIEKALKELETGESTTIGDSREDVPTVEVTTDDSDHQEGEGDDDTHEEGTESIESLEVDPNAEQQDQEDTQEESAEGTPIEQEEDTQEESGGSQEEAVASGEEKSEENEAGEAVEGEESVEGDTKEETDDTKEETDDTKEDTDDTKEDTDDTKEDADDTKEDTDDTKEDTKEDTDDIKEEIDDTKEEVDDTKEEIDDTKEDTDDTKEEADDTKEEADDTKEEADDTKEETDDTQEEVDDTREDAATKEEAESVEAAAQVVEDDTDEETDEVKEETAESVEGEVESTEEQQGESIEAAASQEDQETAEGDTHEDEADTKEDQDETKEEDKDETAEEHDDTGEDTKSEQTEDDKSDTKEDETGEEGGSTEAEGVDEASAEKDDSTPDEAKPEESEEDQATEGAKDESAEAAAEGEDSVAETESVEGETEDKEEDEESESAPEEELSFDVEIPSDLRDRDHVEHLLKIDEEASETEQIINRVAEITLRELKKLYENAIKPLEVLYKYRDLSNRHFGDAEIFAKPLILFMGPWSGGKSSIINYLLDNEYNETSLRTGAEPSPAYFNILMHGDEPEIWDGTQLAADFTFSGLQKFGQGLEERLRGVKLPSKLLEKVNIVEIPGILEVRKQVSRVFPFNDACQWFIDRADIIFLVYDPSKLDVGPETEAILDQLKGREHQTRIILNKADQVKPEELMRVQGALIWNISPLMSSAQPPVMYTTSLWSRPYESWAPSRLLHAQERGFLRDLRTAIDKRIDNKIASARRFAVRVRNHAKMVDCYLTTYYNHKSVFGNRKQVADEITEHPQDYHIYEGLSTLTNISRYDLPDPDVYKDFFKLNALYDFQQLSATCTYFRGCPINRLDVAIAYDLPELVGKHKRLMENALAEASQNSVPGS